MMKKVGTFVLNVEKKGINMTEQSRADKCNNGSAQYVCHDCADKYSNKDTYEKALTTHNNTCYICRKHKIVGPSRKLFGFHIST